MQRIAVHPNLSLLRLINHDLLLLITAIAYSKATLGFHFAFINMTTLVQYTSVTVISD